MATATVDHSPRVAQAVIRIGRELGATDEEIVGALAGGLVESNLRNLNYGDRDSLGPFQQRESIYGRDVATDLEASIRAFFSGARAVTGEWKKGLLETRDMGGTIGERVQAVQISAYPDKYDDRVDEATTLFDLYGNETIADPDPAEPVDAGDVDDDFDVDGAMLPLFQSVSDAVKRGALDPDTAGGGLSSMLAGDEEPGGPQLPDLNQPTGGQAEALRGQIAGTAAFRYSDLPELTLTNGTTITPDGTATPLPGTGQLAAGDKSGSDRSSLAWGGYENGQIPMDELMRLEGLHYSGEGTHYFAQDAGAAMQRMVADAKKDGVDVTLTDSYRSLAAQEDVYARKKGVVAVAKPGTSIHGWGKATDIATGREWVQRNGWRYGWVWPDWARSGDDYEPWHFEYRPA
jgi:hypothetical protein